MSNVPSKRVVDSRGKSLQVTGDSRAPNVTRSLKTMGRKNRNTAASSRGRQHGGGFPKNQV